MADTLERMRLTLADRYRIERELGAGGMATVYLATDLRHDRKVAIKVLRPELAASIGGERFLREIRITAGLAHPNILALIDSGDADGLLFYVMPFIDGESLEQRIGREKQLPIDAALDIAQAVASALAFAHRHGLIHRDIKPANVLLGEDVVMVADFGIARGIEPGAAPMTETGLALGTPGYMSPEQALGEQNIDARSDVYALGCLLYELVVGEPPYTGPTAQAIIVRAMSGSIPKARATRETVPEAIDDVITKALAKSPADRYHDAGAFADALTRARAEPPRKPARWRGPSRKIVGIAAIALFTIITSAWALWTRYSPGGGSASEPSLVVLPFENLGNADDAGFADGVNEEITAKLGDVQGLVVKARQSALGYRGTTKTPQEIARELKVDYILGATLSWEQRPDGQRRVRVRPQLTGRDGNRLWSNTFDEDVTQVFVVQANIASQVVAALTPALTAQGGRATDTAGHADPAAYYRTALTRAIPQDPELHTGTLENGLRYYIRNNAEPKGRAVMRLVVGSGSTAERDGEHGFAHLVEHVAFTGTPLLGDRLMPVLQAAGVRFGADFNGSTSFSHTEYTIQIPTQRAGFVDTTMRLMRDWASAVHFDQRSLDLARKVLFEEWRNGNSGATGQSRKLLIAEFLRGLPEGDHDPAGDSTTIARADIAALTRFYQNAYRPERLSVVIVGDIPADSAELLVRKYFAGIKPAGQSIPRPTLPFPDERKTRVAMIPSPGTAPNICLCYLQRADTALTIGAYRQDVVRRLFVSLLNARVADRAADASAPFLGGGASRSSLTPGNVNMLTVNVSFVDTAMTRALEGVMTETERVARFGFVDAEIERGKARLLRAMQQAYDERGKRQSAAYATEYIESYNGGLPVPGIAFEYGLFKRFLPTVTSAELTALGREWLVDRNRLVMARLDAKSISRTAASDLYAAMQTINVDDIKPYVEHAPRALLPTAVKSGAIVQEDTLTALDAVSWTLSNGARVILKPTDFKSDEILMRAFRRGGTSLASEADFIAARYASNVVRRSGFGDLSAVDLQRSLAGKVATLAPTSTESTDEFSGKTSPRDVEAFMQLLALHFTVPRRDTAVFQSLQMTVRSGMSARAQTPAALLGDTITTTMANGVARIGALAPSRFDAIDFDRSLAFYRARFGDASGFTFIFVGNVDPKVMRPLVEKYIGGLRAGDRVPKARDIGYRPPTGVIKKTIRASEPGKAQAMIIFPGEFSYAEADRQAIRSVGDLLQMRLTAKLREQLGASYNPSATSQFEREPRAVYYVSVQFESAPERTDELIATIFAIIADLSANGPTSDELTQLRATQRQVKETALRENAYWTSQLIAITRYGLDPREVSSYALLDVQTIASIRDAARKYLSLDRYVQVTSTPP